jgi:WD40 repeat protein
MYPVRFSPDGRLIALETYEDKILLWDFRTGKIAREIQNSGSGTRAIAFAPNGKVLISGSFDGAVRFWNLESGELTGILKVIPSASTAGAAHPDWFAFTPNSELDGSPEAMARIRWWDGHENSARIPTGWTEKPRMLGTLLRP